MRIAIVGAGAMGSLFGSMLSMVSDVYLIDPYEDHVNAINEKGLIVEQEDKTSAKFRIFAASDPFQVKQGIDLAIIFTKSYMTAQAAKTALPLLSEKGLILTLQNGLGNMELIADIAGKQRTIAGVTSHGGTLAGPGHVRHAGKGPTYIAPASSNTPSINHIKDIFQAAGIETIISQNLDTLIWGKLIINAGINALAAIIRVPNGTLLTPESEKIMEQAVNEAVNIANALNIELPYDKPFEQVKEVCKKTFANKASMLQDILRGARTEIDVINQAIVKKGRELGIDTPCNAFLSDIIKALEATWENRI
ncbi:2-dehydropantoate 2-reductase [Desulfonema limicola]|uniref:2-dehydropantoate 2-reductase n=1 Tax=Desulfonema limicola TaxID=45656 RepID=A0A975BBW9_9BACT|nr:2-dehydropantoate 2-reductase [Desulfonema limicola]QTA82532.1 2-dehydropantoate 2-reductase [Desulfonema limicola]